MTIALAVRKDQRTILAADSLVNFGGQRYPVENCRFHKLYRVGDSVMAWAGWSLYNELLDAYLAQSPPPQLRNEGEVFHFFLDFWRAMKKEYTLLTRDMDHPFAGLDSVFLLVNTSGIFRVSSDLDVTQFEQYAAVGTGAKYALGALRVLYDQHQSPDRIALLAADVAIEFDVYCGGTIDLAEVNAHGILPPATVSKLRPWPGQAPLGG
jgi:ATP-dependent protease HslVU (ClpYQ) peptidase subunit